MFAYHVMERIAHGIREENPADKDRSAPQCSGFVGRDMSQTKESQRAELHKTIWRIANDLRGSVDGWDFKSYVLGMLFYRYISENLAAYLDKLEREAGETDFAYAKLTDKDAEFGRKDTVDEKGFYILPSELFSNVRKRAASDENLNETLARVFRNIEGSALGTDSEDDLRGLFDDLDVNSGKLGPTVAKRNERLVKLLEAIGDLDLGSEFSEHTIDAFGDAYEYLMTMYASAAGKSGGEFFTPQEVSELLARITVVGKTSVNKVYDPACGSGSLLLKFAKVLGRDNVRQGFFGQEVNLTTYNLARINMFLHDVNYEKFDLAHGDTLLEPAHWDDEPFEAIVSNPPYSINWEGDSNSLLINDPRYAPAGVLAPKSKADLAFTMHMLSWLAVNGTAAIVQFPGVLYRGGAEKKIRQYLVDNNYIDAVIQLPPNLFFGTPIATCVVILKKSKKDNSVLFIDASAEFGRAGTKNKLGAGNLQKILDAFTGREDVDHFAKLIANAAIAENSYHLSVQQYVGEEDLLEEVDIATLGEEITRIVARQNDLRSTIDSIVSNLESGGS
jgi:type I restriction enzyme M protein